MTCKPLYIPPPLSSGREPHPEEIEAAMQDFGKVHREISQATQLFQELFRAKVVCDIEEEKGFRVFAHILDEVSGKMGKYLSKVQRVMRKIALFSDEKIQQKYVVRIGNELSQFIHLQWAPCSLELKNWLFVHQRVDTPRRWEELEERVVALFRFVEKKMEKTSSVSSVMVWYDVVEATIDFVKAVKKRLEKEGLLASDSLAFLFDSYITGQDSWVYYEESIVFEVWTRMEGALIRWLDKRDSLALLIPLFVELIESYDLSYLLTSSYLYRFLLISSRSHAVFSSQILSTLIQKSLERESKLTLCLKGVTLPPILLEGISSGISAAQKPMTVSFRGSELVDYDVLVLSRALKKSSALIESLDFYQNRCKGAVIPVLLEIFGSPFCETQIDFSENPLEFKRGSVLI